MAKAMFEEISRKVIFEVELLVLVTVLSLSASLLLIVDASIALIVENGDLVLVIARICEFAFAMIWLLFSVKMSIELYGLRKRHFRIVALSKLGKLEEKQKRSVAAELVRDMVAFYRANYTKVMAVLALAIGVGFLIVGTVTYLMFNGLISFWAAVFRWTLSSLMLLVASALYVHVHRSWGRKLLRIKDAEKKFSEMLGGSIEV